MGKDHRDGSLNRLRETLVVATRIVKDQGVTSLVAQSIEKIRKREFTVVGPSVPDADYANWIAKYEPDESGLAEQRAKARQLAYRPLLSVVIPVWNPPIDLFAKTIDSVSSQTYDNWELCLADGNSSVNIREAIRNLVDRESRVRAEFLPSNQGISRNSNAGIELARGEFIALLDHDDLLAPNALFEVATSLNERHDVDYVYSDMDHVTKQSRRTDPLFNPDWSPDMMLSNNYADPPFRSQIAPIEGDWRISSRNRGNTRLGSDSSYF